MSARATEGANRLRALYAEGRLVRREWSGMDALGRQLFCLYTGFAGDEGARPFTCTADLAPRWIAYLLPWLDDAPSDGEWPRVVERVIALAPRLPEVSDACEWRVREAVVREAMRCTDDADVLEVCERVCGVLRRMAAGEDCRDVIWPASVSLSEGPAWMALAARTARAAVSDRGTATFAVANAADLAARTTGAPDRVVHLVLDAIEEDLAREAAK